MKNNFTFSDLKNSMLENSIMVNTSLQTYINYNYLFFYFIYIYSKKTIWIIN